MCQAPNFSKGGRAFGEEAFDLAFASPQQFKVCTPPGSLTVSQDQEFDILLKGSFASCTPQVILTPTLI
jgi:hypothetical protein